MNLSIRPSWDLLGYQNKKNVLGTADVFGVDSSKPSKRKEIFIWYSVFMRQLGCWTANMVVYMKADWIDFYLQELIVIELFCDTEPIPSLLSTD